MLKTLDFKGNYEEIATKFSTRKEDISKQVNDIVMDIIDDVKKNGDKALMKYAQKFDGFMIDDPIQFITTKQEILDGVSSVGKDFMRILERTKQQLIDFHQNQVDKSWSLYKGNGVMMGQLVRKCCFICSRRNSNLSFNSYDECYSCEIGRSKKSCNHHTC